jgi:hypothetical protein
MVQSDNVPSYAARNKDWCQKRYVINILIVDDDALHGRSVRDLLAAHNYLADVEYSGHGGLDRLLQAPVDETPVNDTQGTFTGSYGVIRDVTEAKRTWVAKLSTSNCQQRTRRRDSISNPFANE